MNWSFHGDFRVCFQTSGLSVWKSGQLGLEGLLWCLSLGKAEQVPMHTGLWETHKCFLPSGCGAVLQLSHGGMSDHPCLPEVPTHVCFISNPSQYKWMFAGPWDHTDYLRQNNNCSCSNSEAISWTYWVGRKSESILKKSRALDRAQVPKVLFDDSVCFSKRRYPEVLVLYFKQNESLIRRCWHAVERSSVDSAGHLTEFKHCITQLHLV